MTGARRRLRDLGYPVGRFATGPLNALVDVSGVRVGHRTVIEDPPGAAALRTGVTAVLPHGGNTYAEKVLGACHVVNGYGKMTGLTQLDETGTIEAPILLTSTVSVGPAWEGGLRHVLERNPEAGRAGSANVIVGECFDGWLSDARALRLGAEHALDAIDAARGDETAEGSVGAGTGTSCLGFKGGVGSASRVTEHGGHLLGCLVVTNYGGRRDLPLLVEGELGRSGPPASGAPEAPAAPASGGPPPAPASGATSAAAASSGPFGSAPADGGSAIVVLATDAPLSERQLRRVAVRGAFGLVRAASYARNRSGDYVIAFSTAHRVPHEPNGATDGFAFLRDDGRPVADLFEAAPEVTYEAVLNSLCVADAMDGRDGHRLEAFPYELLPRLRAL